MESKNELKEIDIKNCTCYYFDDIMRAWDRDIDIDFSGILSDEKYFNLWYFIPNFNGCKIIAY